MVKVAYPCVASIMITSKVTPVGFLLPDQDELSIAVCTSNVTSDCIVDVFDHWWDENKTRFPDVDTLVLLQDNGPENSGRRTPFLSRMVNFVEKHHVNVRLAYYPDPIAQAFIIM